MISSTSPLISAFLWSDPVDVSQCNFIYTSPCILALSERSHVGAEIGVLIKTLYGG